MSPTTERSRVVRIAVLWMFLGCGLGMLAREPQVRQAHEAIRRAYLSNGTNYASWQRYSDQILTAALRDRDIARRQTAEQAGRAAARKDVASADAIRANARIRALGGALGELARQGGTP